MPLAVDRREFFRIALVAGVAARLQADTVAPSRWALLSDLHCPLDRKDVYRGFHPYENLNQATASVAASPAEFCAITGDLARLTGQPGDYETLRESLKAVLDKIPTGLALGNHDHRANFENAFPSPQGIRQKVARKHVMTFEWTDLRAVFLDSLLETNVTPGQLGTAQRRWLAEYAAADQRPVLLFLHHDFRDQDGSLVDAAKFLETVAPLSQVKAVFYGHSHEYHVETREGLHLVNIPSTAFTFRDQDPVGWMEMTLSKSGAELLLHVTAGNKEMNGTKAMLRWR
jgi:3',5'-cyclic AMP phosphodiesterase CpdA